jgi:Methylamine utilisation protein MauE
MVRGKLKLWATAAVGTAVLACVGVAAMPGVGFVARGLLAGVFVLAAVAKLGDRRSFSEGLAGLGISGSIAPALGLGLPMAELVVAGALLVPATSTAGGFGSVLLLLVLTAGVGLALSLGQTADCGCFGRDHSGQFGGLTLMRNGLLLGLAGGLAALGLEHQSGSGRPLAAVGTAAFVGLALLATSKRARDSAEPLTVTDLAGPSPTSDAAVTRRRWLRWAGGAGIAGALGSSMSLLEVSTASGATSGSGQITIPCTACTCQTFCQKPNSKTVYCCVYVCTSCEGFTGGGVIQTATGTVHASFFGNHTKLSKQEELFGGALSWFDAGWQGTGLLLQSTQITHYGKVAGTSIRQLEGFVSANGSGKHKFVLRAIDGGKPGSGSDTVTLAVSGITGGGAGGTGSEYIANGRLAQGDISTKLVARALVKK